MSTALILSKLPQDVIDKMYNWVRSKAGGGMYASSKVFRDVVISSGFDDTHVPILRGEAEDVDNALLCIPAQLRQAVSLFWQHDHPPLAWLGRRLSPPPGRRPLDYRTVRDRIIRGHELMVCELRRQRAAARRYNADAERLGAAS